MFKESISLTYKGEESYSSIIGGISTIIIFLILSTISVFLFIRMFKRNDISWNQNVVFDDHGTSNKSIIITEKDNIEIYVVHQYKLLASQKKIEDMTRYYQIVLKTFNAEKGEIKVKETKWKDPEYLNTLVGPAKDGIVDKYSPVPAKNYRKGYWFNLDGISFEGDVSHYGRYSGATIELEYWRTHPSTWMPASTIHNTLRYSLISTRIKSNYVDLNDIQNPIKPYYFTPNGFRISQSKGDSIYLKVASNQVTLEDSLLSNLLPPDYRSFNSLSMSNSVSQNFLEDLPDNSYTFIIKIDIDNREFQYNRKILDFLEVSGAIGGIFEILEVFIGAISGYLTSYFFRRELKDNLEKTEK